jgi:hypothetical protein
MNFKDMPRFLCSKNSPFITSGLVAEGTSALSKGINIYSIKLDSNPANYAMFSYDRERALVQVPLRSLNNWALVPNVDKVLLYTALQDYNYAMFYKNQRNYSVQLDVLEDGAVAYANLVIPGQLFLFKSDVTRLLDGLVRVAYEGFKIVDSVYSVYSSSDISIEELANHDTRRSEFE